MSEELYNIFSAIGICLTFLASMSATIISVISLKYSNRAAKRSGYLNTITAGRDRWSYSLRESAALYFTQIARICNGQEKELEKIYNELLRYHFMIVLLLFKDNNKIIDNMNEVKRKAFEIVDQNSIIVSQYMQNEGTFNNYKTDIEDKDIVIQVRKRIYELRCSILQEYHGRILSGLSELLEREWRRQQYEATEMWNEK